jgi:hypothetical protein
VYDSGRHMNNGRSLRSACDPAIIALSRHIKRSPSLLKLQARRTNQARSSLPTMPVRRPVDALTALKCRLWTVTP